MSHTHIGPLDVVNVVFHTQRTNLAQLRLETLPTCGTRETPSPARHLRLEPYFSKHSQRLRRREVEWDHGARRSGTAVPGDSEETTR